MVGALVWPECLAAEKDVHSRIREIVEITKGDDYKGIAVSSTGARHDTASSLLYECEEQIALVLAQEQTYFLCMPLLERYFTQIRPLLVVRVNDLLSDDFRLLDKVRAVLDIFSESVISAAWRQKCERFREIAEGFGYTLFDDDYRDIAKIAPILTNALTILDAWGAKSYCVRSGALSNAPPILCRGMPRVRTPDELVRMLEAQSSPCCIMFGVIEKTFGDTNDDMADWYGAGNLRKRSIMRSDGLTKEEYLALPDTHSRQVYVVIKRGGAVSLQTVPIKSDGYSTLASFDYYGKRNTYLPIQVFFKDAPCPEGCADALIPVGADAWDVTKLLDEEQKVWLPVFVDELSRRYFRNTPENTEVVCMKGETRVALASGFDLCLPAVPSQLTVRVPAPEEVFTDSLTGLLSQPQLTQDVTAKKAVTAARLLCRLLNVSDADISDAPIRGKDFLTADEMREWVQKQAAAAYIKVLSDKLLGLWRADAPAAQMFFWSALEAKLPWILREYGNGMYDSFTAVTIDGRVILDKDGNTKKVMHFGVPRLDKHGNEVYATEKTSASDTRPDRRTINPFMGRNYLYPDTLQGKRPYAVISFMPKSLDDILGLLDCRCEDLPQLLQLKEATECFAAVSQRDEGVDMEWWYGSQVLRWHGPFRITTRFTVCLSKTAYKNMVCSCERRQNGTAERG